MVQARCDAISPPIPGIDQIWILLLMTAICAIAGNVYLGDRDGLIGVIAYGALIGLAILIAVRLRSEVNQRS